MKFHVKSYLGGILNLALILSGHAAAAQSVSFYTTPDHNSYVQVSASTSVPLSLQSTASGLPGHQGWFALRGQTLEYNGDRVFGAYRLAQKQMTPVISDPGLTGVHSVSNSTGTVAWFYSQTKRKVYLNAYDSSWTQLWTKDLTDAGPTFLGIPALSQGSVYYGSGNNAVSVSLATGQVLWNTPLPALVFDTLTVSSGVVLASTQKGLYALNAVDGRVLWSQPTAQSLQISDFGRVFSANGRFACKTSMDGTVSLIDLTTGSVIWSVPPGGTQQDAQHPPILGDAGILVPLVGGLKLIDYTGKTVWTEQYEFLSRKLSQPDYLMLANVALAGGADGLYAVSLADGHILWRSAASAEVNGLQYAGGSVYVSFRDNTLQIFSPTAP